ncbi:TrkH family potassium uptake protein [Parvularcula dongshanensis]|uniref:Trk system potassium uptake protein TrkH n=1 Tax=Parvularcula dongshanensis TaxID=1173995 RepID=A0A840I6X8_9PROT|nr:TrkH family potassium uptake protein [Parvularcula dongshanensis]MBB4660003.1 trk system potassium uptake protein TrkH [Parvularcula dongshanensis]
MSFAPIARFLAYAFFAVAICTIIPGIYCAVTRSPDLDGYAFAFGLSLFAGGAALAFSSGLRERPAVRGGLRELLAALVLFWAGVPIVAAVPFFQQGWSYGDAWFEAVSGLTTTGAWLSSPSARASEADMLYRASLQWTGGLVSLCTAAAIFVRAEFMGVAPLVPPFARGESGSYLRAFAAAYRVFLPVFSSLTAIGLLTLFLLGVPIVEAVVLSMSLLSTSGFVPDPGGIESYGVPVTIVAVVLMALGAVNFIVVAQVSTGRRRRMRGGEDRETLTFFLLCPAIALLFWLSAGAGDLDRLLPQLFNAVSILSTNGVTIGEPPQLTPVLVTAVIGGAAVSTAGGVKLLRWLVTFDRAGEELWKLIHPGGVVPRPVTINEFGVWIHTIAFTILLAVFVLITAFFGSSLEASAATAVAMVANVGPLLDLAPRMTADYVLLDGALRPLLALGMIAGRLELVVLLVLLNRRFWES